MKRLKLGTDGNYILWQEKKLVQAKPKENNLQMNELSPDLELLDDRRNRRSIFFLFEADFIQLVVLNLSHLNYIKLCLFLTSNER